MANRIKNFMRVDEVAQKADLWMLSWTHCTAFVLPSTR